MQNLSTAYKSVQSFWQNLPGGYRYGFQGQEKDDEIKGEGNSINYTYRMHDPRIGRFFAVDPLSSDYPMLSVYQFSANNPIGLVEIEGLEGDIPIPMGSEPALSVSHESFIQTSINNGIRPTMQGRVYKFQYNNSTVTYGRPPRTSTKKGEYWVYIWNDTDPKNQYYDVFRQSNKAGEAHLASAGFFKPTPPPANITTQDYQTTLNRDGMGNQLDGTLTNPNNGQVTILYQSVSTYDQSQITASINSADQTVAAALTNVPATNTVNSITITVDTNLGQTYFDAVKNDVNANYANSGVTINYVQGNTGDSTVPYSVSVDSSLPYP